MNIFIHIFLQIYEEPIKINNRIMKFIFNLQKSCIVKHKATGKNILHLPDKMIIRMTERDLYRAYEKCNQDKKDLSKTSKCN